MGAFSCQEETDPWLYLIWSKANRGEPPPSSTPPLPQLWVNPSPTHPPLYPTLGELAPMEVNLPIDGKVEDGGRWWSRFPATWRPHGRTL